MTACVAIAACSGRDVDDPHVGATCASDDDCSPRGASVCATHPIESTPNAPTFELSLPDPVCIMTSCTIPSGAPLCANGEGFCYQSYPGAPTDCLPLCTYRESAGASLCPGADSCQIRYVDGSTSELVGYGICYFGCQSDADCKQGTHCQREYGGCIATPLAFAGSPGEPCTIADDGVLCNCLYTDRTGAGYCTSSCVTGGSSSSCPAGFVCDVELPSASATGTKSFLEPPPPGLRGYCLKTCAGDTDCAALSSSCLFSGGMTQATCHPG